MYGRARSLYRAQRRKDEIKGYLGTMMWVVTVLCIVIVAVAMAVKTNKASKVIAAEAAESAMTDIAVTDTPIQLDEKSVTDIAQAVTSGQMFITDKARERAQEEAERVIIIDPGHGGIDGGCVFGDIVEKDINKKIAYRVVQKLRIMGYHVELARKGDEYIDKTDRVEMANSRNARLYVSIHQNSCEDKSVAGIETWYDESDEASDSKRLAMLIQQETVNATGATGRELVSDPNLCVTSKSTMPACLIETGFLSNRSEREKLASAEYRDQIAEGIANGIDLYLNPKTMYLTFDDGPSEEYTDMVLDVLKEKNIKATFFVIGEYVRKYPETAKRIAEEGHTIGIHCDVHDYQKLYESVDSYIEDFEKAYDTVYEITGVQAQLFRFPGGSVNAYNKAVYQDIIKEMEERGFVYYDWNASLGDAAKHTVTSEELIGNAVSTARGRREVVMLAHDRVDNTAYALGELIDALPEYRMERLTTKAVPVQF